jgi:hypothetical protein
MTTDTLTGIRRTRSPEVLALLVLVGQWLVVGLGALVAAFVLEDADGTARSLVASVAVLVFSVVVARAVAVRDGGWRSVGLTHPREWRDTKLLVVPALITWVPLLGGVRSIEGGTWAVLVAGYVLTGFMEELPWHGATDFFAAIGGLPKIPVLVGQDVVLLVLGALLIRGTDRAE